MKNPIFSDQQTYDLKLIETYLGIPFSGVTFDELNAFLAEHLQVAKTKQEETRTHRLAFLECFYSQKHFRPEDYKRIPFGSIYQWEAVKLVEQQLHICFCGHSFKQLGKFLSLYLSKAKRQSSLSEPPNRTQMGQIEKMESALRVRFHGGSFSDANEFIRKYEDAYARAIKAEWRCSRCGSPHQPPGIRGGTLCRNCKNPAKYTVVCVECQTEFKAKRKNAKYCPTCKEKRNNGQFTVPNAKMTGQNSLGKPFGTGSQWSLVRSIEEHLQVTFSGDTYDEMQAFFKMYYSRFKAFNIPPATRRLIAQMEKVLGVQFEGCTVNDAGRFIASNRAEYDRRYNERFRGDFEAHLRDEYGVGLEILHHSLNGARGEFLLVAGNTVRLVSCQMFSGNKEVKAATVFEESLGDSILTEPLKSTMIRLFLSNNSSNHD